MRTIAAYQSYREEIKKSVFIAHAAPCAHEHEARQFIEDVTDPKARHNCWAYRIGELFRFFDDGEPGGTAGRPIIRAIDAKQLDRVVVLVVRFFGGIKLGTGGLARAYGGCAAKCLDGAQLLDLIAEIEVSLEIPFAFVGAVARVLDEYRASRIDEHYSTDGQILRVRIAQSYLQQFEQAVQDSGHGQVIVTKHETVISI